MKNADEKNAWLLIKHKDEFAVNKSYSSEKETAPDSPINKEIKEEKSEKMRKSKRRDHRSSIKDHRSKIIDHK
jgi:bifunctional non-homologous end joining protein LigD